MVERTLHTLGTVKKRKTILECRLGGCLTFQFAYKQTKTQGQERHKRIIQKEGKKAKVSCTTISALKAAVLETSFAPKLWRFSSQSALCAGNR